MNSSKIESLIAEQVLLAKLFAKPFSKAFAEQTVLQKLKNLDRDCLDYPWEEKQWESFFESQMGRCLLFQLRGANDESMQGFVLFHLNPWERQAHLLKIALKPELRGGGGAGMLFEAGKNWLKRNNYSQIYLEASAANQRALGFYKKNNFTRLCVKKRFYSDGQDAVALLLTL
ncbi:MAG: GNAT family N-acetyltransferase [Bacteriovoracaceae bacterium]